MARTPLMGNVQRAAAEVARHELEARKDRPRRAALTRDLVGDIGIVGLGRLTAPPRLRRRSSSSEPALAGLTVCTGSSNRANSRGSTKLRTGSAGVAGRGG